MEGKNSQTIAVLGTGYVGLVAGVCLSDFGRNVICIDHDVEKIAKLQRGEVPFFEPGLESLIVRNVKEKRLTFTSDTATAVRASKLIILAVGTPPMGDGQTDLSQVLAASTTIAENLQPGTCIIIKSTVPVGTTFKMRDRIKSITDVPFHVGFNPEFLREGSAVGDFMNPARTIIGCEDQIVEDVTRELYQSFISEKSPLVVTDILSAEMIKYAANSMLAVRISFMNDISVLCEKLGADVEMIKLGIGLDDRIGNKFLNPGVGIGGSCFPKDVKSLIHTGKEKGEELPMLRAVMDINYRMPRRFVKKVSDHFGGDLKGKTFALWGLAYKANTDDMREAPSIIVAQELCEAGATCVAFDPAAMDNAKLVVDPRVRYADDIYAAAKGADAVLVLTEWNEFRHPDWTRLNSLVRCRLMFDGRNIYQPDAMQKLGYTYYSQGRKIVRA